MTILEAQNIAEEFTRKFNHQMTDHRLGLINPRSFQNCFYFDFTSINLDGSRNSTNAGGASGVIVDKNNNEPRSITFSELNLLESNQKELERIYAFITKARDTDDLIFIKKIFQLTAEQFVSFQQDILNSKGSKEKMLIVIQRLLDSQSNSS